MRTRLLYWTIVCLVMLAGPLSGQRLFYDWDLNARAGVVLSGLEENIIYENFADTLLEGFNADNKAGFTIGADLRMPMQGLSFFNPGIYYTRFSTQLAVDDEENLQVSETRNYNAIRIPINVGVLWRPDDAILGFHARGGLVPSFLFSGNEDETFSLDADEVRSFNTAFQISLGLDLVRRITFNASYEKNFSDFFTNLKGKNEFITIDIGLLLTVKKAG